MELDGGGGPLDIAGGEQVGQGAAQGGVGLDHRAGVRLRSQAQERAMLLGREPDPDVGDRVGQARVEECWGSIIASSSTRARAIVRAFYAREQSLERMAEETVTAG